MLDFLHFTPQLDRLSFFLSLFSELSSLLSLVFSTRQIVDLALFFKIGYFFFFFVDNEDWALLINERQWEDDKKKTLEMRAENVLLYMYFYRNIIYFNFYLFSFWLIV